MLNVEKLIDEASVYVHTWMHPPAPQHDDAGTVYSNRFTEATRASVYFAAHVDQIVWPGFTVMAIVEIVRAVV